MDTDNRFAPYDGDAEKAILGSILIDPVKVIQLCLETGVTADTFYVPAHRTIYQAMLDVSSANKIADSVVVKNRLRETDSLEKVGGDAFIEEIMDATPTAAHSEHYIESAIDKQRKRTAIELGRQAQNLAIDPDLSGDDAIVMMLDKFFDHAKTNETAKTNCEAIREKIQEWKNAEKGVFAGLECFLPRLTRVLGRFKFGKLYFLGAAPAGGKSTFMHNQARFWAVDQNIPCAINTVEMKHDELIGRVIAEMADVSTFAMDNGFEHGNHSAKGSRVERVLEQAKRLVDENTGEMIAPLYMDDRQMNIDELAVWARLMVHKHGVKAIMVDYVQIIGAPKGFKGTERERLDYISNKLRDLAKSLDVVFLVLSQLSGDGGMGNKPSPFNLFGSKTMQHAAYGIIMLYRNKEGQHLVDVQKGRGGPEGEIVVDFNKSRQRFEDDQSIDPGKEGIDLPEEFNIPQAN